VVEGRSKLEHYGKDECMATARANPGEGLELAKLAALPEAVTLKARIVTDRRSALEEQGAVRLEATW
jgi:hypothetical protein